MVDLFGKGDDETRYLAGRALCELGPDAAPAVPDLLRALHDMDPNIRALAAGALGSIGPDAENSAPILVEGLRDENASIRKAFALALAGIGPGAKEAIPALIHALDDDNQDVVDAAVTALGEIGPAAGDATPRLARILAKSASPDVARALGNIGPNARAAIPALTEMLNGVAVPPGGGTGVSEWTEDNGYRRTAAALALWRIAHQTKGISDLINILEDKAHVFRGAHDNVRIAAVEAVGNIGPAAKAAVPYLIDLLKNDHGAMREAAARALGGIGDEAKASIPALRAMLRDEWAGEAAAVALGKMGRIAVDAAPDLEAILDPETLCSISDYHRQMAAADALQKVSGRTEKSIGVLLTALRFYGFPQMIGPRSYTARRAAHIRQRAAIILGNFAAAAKPAILFLADAARGDEFLTVRRAAAKAIWRIDPREAAAMFAR